VSITTTMAPNNFIMTIDSDDEDLSPSRVLPSAKPRSVDPPDPQLNAEFTFDLVGDPYADILSESNLHDLVKKGSRPVSTFNVVVFQSTIFMYARNQSPSTTSSRGANYLHRLGSANEILMDSRKANMVRPKTHPKMKIRMKSTKRTRMIRSLHLMKMPEKGLMMTLLKMKASRMQFRSHPMTPNPRHRQKWIVKQPSSTRMRLLLKSILRFLL
jgi:hypothetical protein